jgi:hypothetical protein
LIDGVALAPLEACAKILSQDEIALGRGYHEMHSTSSALASA